MDNNNIHRYAPSPISLLSSHLSPLNQREKGEERDWERRNNPIVEASVF